jgi:hypothetical protein
MTEDEVKKLIREDAKVARRWFWYAVGCILVSIGCQVATILVARYFH